MISLSLAPDCLYLGKVLKKGLTFFLQAIECKKYKLTFLVNKIQTKRRINGEENKTNQAMFTN